MALTLSEQLIEAKSAYHDLMTGAAVVEMRESSGDVVRYTTANSTKLKAYISDLTQKIIDASSGATDTRYPMRLQF